MADLAAFLAEAAGREMEWGRFDCSMLVASWVERVRGVHPAPHLVERYADAGEALAITEASGGLPTLFRSLLDPAGLRETDAPRPGDVAVVAWQGKHYGAIRAASGWAVKTTRGVLISNAFRPLVIWSV